MIIFDLDGTLYRTHETCLPPLLELCQSYHITLTKEDEKYLLYTTSKDLLRRVSPHMTQDQQEEFISELRRKELEAVNKYGRLFDHVAELLAELAMDGVEMAICGMGRQEQFLYRSNGR